MKKIIPFLAIVIIFNLTACGTKSSAKNTETAIQPTEIYTIQPTISPAPYLVPPALPKPTAERYAELERTEPPVIYVESTEKPSETPVPTDEPISESTAEPFIEPSETLNPFADVPQAYEWKYSAYELLPFIGNYSNDDLAQFTDKDFAGIYSGNSGTRYLVLGYSDRKLIATRQSFVTQGTPYLLVEYGKTEQPSYTSGISPNPAPSLLWYELPNDLEVRLTEVSADIQTLSEIYEFRTPHGLIYSETKGVGNLDNYRFAAYRNEKVFNVYLAESRKNYKQLDETAITAYGAHKLTSDDQTMFFDEREDIPCLSVTGSLQVLSDGTAYFSMRNGNGGISDIRVTVVGFAPILGENYSIVGDIYWIPDPLLTNNGSIVLVVGTFCIQEVQ